MSATELEINRHLKVLAVKDRTVQLTFVVAGQPNIGPIDLSLAEAVQAGGDIAKVCSSERIPNIIFNREDARVFGPWLMRFAA